MLIYKKEGMLINLSRFDMFYIAPVGSLEIPRLFAKQLSTGEVVCLADAAEIKQDVNGAVLEPMEKELDFFMDFFFIKFMQYLKRENTFFAYDTIIYDIIATSNSNYTNKRR